MRGQRRGPAASTATATGTLAFGEQDLHARCGGPAQQFGIGRVDVPGQIERIESGRGGAWQPGADLCGIQQVQRRSQRITAAGIGAYRHASGTQGMDMLPYRRAGQAEFLRQRTAARRGERQALEQLAIVHGRGQSAAGIATV